MSNIQGVQPKWISPKSAGINPFYKDQISKGLKLERDLEVELDVFNNWVKLEVGQYDLGDGITDLPGGLAAVGRVGRPVVVSIGHTIAGKNFVNPIDGNFKRVLSADVCTNWITKNENGSKFCCTIPYFYSVEPGNSDWGGHRKGLIKGVQSSKGPDNLITPKVRVYRWINSDSRAESPQTNNSIFEEVYDSPEIDIFTGDITLRTNQEDALYLVVIY